MRLGKRSRTGFQAAEHLVCRHVHETENGLIPGRQYLPVLPYRLQQAERADDIGLDEIGRPMDRAVYMAFGRKMDDGTRLVCCQQLRDQRVVADVTTHECMAGIALQ